jgi:hypothetical protein
MATPFPFVSGNTLTAAQLNAITTLPVSTKTNSYTLTVADLGTRVVMNSASATTITVNTSIFGASDVVEILNIGAGVCTVTAGTCTVATSGTLALVQNAGGSLTFISASASVFTASASGAGITMAVFNETQASGTNGGTSTSGSFIKRTLNTTVKNDITGCSIASSVITLPAGTFYVFASSPVIQAGYQQAKIRNTTDSTDLALSTSGYSPPATSVSIDSNIQGLFVLAASKTIELQYRVQTGVGTNGLGVATSFGSEIYSQITIMKVA